MILTSGERGTSLGRPAPAGIQLRELAMWSIRRIGRYVQGVLPLVVLAAIALAEAAGRRWW